MYIAYFDEVKPMPQHGRDHYLVGGIAVPMEQIGALERAVTNLAVEIFGSHELVPGTEFHANYCYFGKSHFKGMEPATRISILVRLAALIAHADGVKRVYAAINQTKIYNAAPEYAFAHFVERMEMAIPNDQSCILIGDLDDEQSTNMVCDFSRFRQLGTPWAHGIDINRVVDSVHFCRSHHSRLLQLADVYLFIVAGKYGGRKGWMKDEFVKAFDGLDLYAHRFKDWPK